MQKSLKWKWSEEEVSLVIVVVRDEVFGPEGSV
jgi:hypothetical protein